jgi:RNA polymerase sigma-70 factor, ECF subfamily
MSDGPPSDAELIERCRRGEVEEFRLLVKRYQDRVYNLAFRLLGSSEDARDAAQDTFIRVFSALPRFEVDRPFAPWLFRIATNACYGRLRERQPPMVFLDALAVEEADTLLAASTAVRSGTGDPQEELARSLRDEEIRRAVLALPEPYRTAALLRFMEEMSYDEIAQALEMPLGTVKTCLHRARRRLREALAEGEE